MGNSNPDSADYNSLADFSTPKKRQLRFDSLDVIKCEGTKYKRIYW